MEPALRQALDTVQQAALLTAEYEPTSQAALAAKVYVGGVWIAR